MDKPFAGKLRKYAKGCQFKGIQILPKDTQEIPEDPC
jgi:hypothetical protein